MGIKTKHGFVFSFLAIFLGALILYFASANLHEGNYDAGDDFKKARIFSLQSEIHYFQEIYLKQVLEHFLSDSLGELVFMLNTTTPPFDKDPDLLNQYVLEVLVNGTIDGTSKPSIFNVSKTIENYRVFFASSYRGDINISFNKVSLYEKRPYYVSMLVDGTINVSTFDNISTWFFNKTFDISIPIYDLTDPYFLMETGVNVTLKPVERFSKTINWSIDLLNETINETYSVFYNDFETQYSLGNSFLKRLLNITDGPYKGVVGAWSFENDELFKQVYDSSRHSGKGLAKTSSLLLLRFDNESVDSVGNVAYDLSSYKADADIRNGADCEVQGIASFGCAFDGVNDFLEVESNKLFFNGSGLALSLWVYTNPLPGGEEVLFDYGSLPNEKIRLEINNQKAVFVMGPHSTGVSFELNSTTNLSLGWNHIIANYNTLTGEAALYLNGVPSGNLTRSPSGVLLSSSARPRIGAAIGNSLFFSGIIDEVGLYQKVLDGAEISALFKERRALFIEYKDEALYDKSLYFDGEDDYVQVGDDDQYDYASASENLTLEVWFKPLQLFGNQTLLSKGFSNEDGFSLNLVGGKISFQSADEYVVSDDVLVDSTKDWYYVTLVRDKDASPEISLYLNGKKMGVSRTVLPSPVTNEDFFLTFGKDASADSHYYYGYIDEVRVSEKALSAKEIEGLYRNYGAIAKGCCNYITLVNPEKFGYNTVAFRKNVSYSSKLFYDYYNNSPEITNITLRDVTNITSLDTSKPHYNFLIDACLNDAFSIADYDFRDVVSFNTIGEDYFNCSYLIQKGIY
ncbi:MAG: LamG domain-containing protein [Candidatus Woesearchaeota archaeon]|nr:MAG: LamG domain-containing protein [Candidatus Woesearchaeota archaeon]